MAWREGGRERGRKEGRDLLSKEERKSVVFILVDHAVMTVLT